MDRRTHAASALAVTAGGQHGSAALGGSLGITAPVLGNMGTVISMDTPYPPKLHHDNLKKWNQFPFKRTKHMEFVDS